MLSIDVTIISGVFFYSLQYKEGYENFAETDCLFCGKMVSLTEIDREIGTKEEPI